MRLHLLVTLFLYLLQPSVQKPVDDEPKSESALDDILKANKDVEIEGVIETDMLFGPDQNINDRKRNALRDRHGIWVTKQVPYVIDSALQSYESKILAAMGEYHQQTCVQFIPKESSHTYWLKFQSGTGCSSYVGRQLWKTNGQEVTLGPGCYNHGTIVHELKHALGFYHEQSRPDRDNYVEIMWENIRPGKENNFNSYDHYGIDDLGQQYDFGSVMHYGRFFFSANGQATMIKIGDPEYALGQRNGLSTIDALEVNSLYDCDSSAHLSTWSEFSPCKYVYGNCQKYRQQYCSSNNPSVDCSGANQYGIINNVVNCDEADCNVAVDGHWGAWGEWGSCSVTCGEGNRTRTRSCNNPAPSNGGAECSDSDTDSSSCTLLSCGFGEVNCNFDKDMCEWVDFESTILPQLNSGSTPTSGTGPTNDNTSGSGQYLYMETSDPAKSGEKTRIISALLPDAAVRCFKFWYNMNGGSTMGAIKVYRRLESNGDETMYSETTGNQGTSWIEKKMLLQQAGGTYRMIIELIRGGSYDTDIAIDDITVKDGFC